MRLFNALVVGVDEMETGVKKMKNLLNKYRLFTSILFSGALVTGITVLMVAILASASYRNTLKREVIRWKRDSIDAFQHTTGTLFQQIQTNSVSFLLSSVVSDYEESFYSDMFSQAQYRPDERQILNRGRLAMAIANFSMSNPLIHSAYFYDRALEQVITADGLGYSLDRFYDQEILKFTKEDQLYPMNFEARKLTQKSTGYPKEVVTIAFKTFSRGNSFIVNLDAELLYKKLFEGGNSSGYDGKLFFCSADGKILLGESQGEIYPAIETLRQAVEEESAYFEAEGAITFYSYSQLLNGYFVESGDLDYFMEEKGADRSMMSVGIMGIILFGLLLFFALTWMIYRPIRRLVYRLTDGKRDSSEVDSISNAYSHVRDQYSEIEERMDRNRPIIKAALLQSVLFGNRMVASRTQERMEEAGIHIPQGKVQVAVFQIRPEQKMQPFAKEYDLFLAAMQQVEEQLALVEGLFVQAGEHLVFITASSEYESICDGSTAYQQACDMLRYQIVLGEGSVICADDIKLGEKPAYNYPDDMEAELLDQILQRNITGAVATMERIILRITAKENQLTVTQIRQYLLILFGDLLKRLGSMGVDLNDILSSDGIFYDRLLFSVNREEITDLFIGLIERIEKQVAYQQDRKNTLLMEVATDYINRNYQRGISLEEVAEQVKLSPTYLSRLMKQEKGCGFSQYLAQLRIKYAKEMLKHTSMKVEDIGSKVGYPNANYFIRIFKEKTGCTPGEYRARAIVYDDRAE